MGNKKFRLSEMMPNAWFYKLKEMGTRNRNPQKTINPSTKKKKQPPTASSSVSSTTSSLTCSSLSSSSSSSTTTSSSSTTTTTTSIPPHNSKSQNHPQNSHSHQRKSYYFTRNLINPPSMQDPKSQQTHFLLESAKKSPKQYPESYFRECPRKSPKQKHSNSSKRTAIASLNKQLPQKLITSSVSSGCGCRASLDLKSDDYPISPLDSSSDHESLLPELGSDHDRNPENDIVFNINDNAKSDEHSAVTEVELHPILTKMDQKTRKSVEFEGKNALPHGYISNNNVTEQRTSSVSSSSVRRLSVSSQGVRIRTNSPRMGNRRFQGKAGRGRRSVSESFAVVKSSSDPRMDFRESMLEMIIENNIRASKDLEDLLACYLQLNSDEYHEVIIKVFKQIWFDLANVRLK